MVVLLENLGVSEKIINPLRNSSVGYYALTYALYKVASPARYAVTVGGRLNMFYSINNNIVNLIYLSLYRNNSFNQLSYKMGLHQTSTILSETAGYVR